MSPHAVTPDEAGLRADVLTARLSGASRSLVAQAARDGLLRVNGEASKGSRVLAAGDRLAFEIPQRTPLVAGPEKIALPILFEDDDVIVVDKPAGMVTHPAPGSVHGSLVSALLAHAGSLPGDALRPGLIHRLDRDTSGLLVVAKSEEALQELRKAMAARRISREYLGLVHGAPVHARGRIEGPIGRDPRNRLKYAVVADGKPAITHYEVRERFPKHAELIFRLETGRTHQIRVHAAAMGHPVLNDPLYGHEEPRFGLPGQALHAWRLDFAHPRTGAALSFESEPPPAYLRARAMLA
ncbi:MAG TPA: RluA family pseudouridine synthase [Candidatus Tyrphobacter sp.]